MCKLNVCKITDRPGKLAPRTAHQDGEDAQHVGRDDAQDVQRGQLLVITHVYNKNDVV